MNILELKELIKSNTPKEELKQLVDNGDITSELIDSYIQELVDLKVEKNKKIDFTKIRR